MVLFGDPASTPLLRRPTIHARLQLVLQRRGDAAEEVETGTGFDGINAGAVVAPGQRAGGLGVGDVHSVILFRSYIR